MTLLLCAITWLLGFWVGCYLLGVTDFYGIDHQAGRDLATAATFVWPLAVPILAIVVPFVYFSGFVVKSGRRLRKRIQNEGRVSFAITKNNQEIVRHLSGLYPLIVR